MVHSRNCLVSRYGEDALSLFPDDIVLLALWQGTSSGSVRVCSCEILVRRERCSCCRLCTVSSSSTKRIFRPFHPQHHVIQPSMIDIPAVFIECSPGMRRILDLFSRTKYLKTTRIPSSLYFWGGTGSGKTYIMNLFFEAIPFTKKRRVHFNNFMVDVHQVLRLSSFI